MKKLKTFKKQNIFFKFIIVSINYRKRIWLAFIFFLCSFLFVYPCFSQMLADPARNIQEGNFEVGLSFMREEHGYDIEFNPEFEYEPSYYNVDRQTISLYGAYGISEKLDVFLAVTYIHELISESKFRRRSFASDRRNEGNQGKGAQLGLRYGSYFGKSSFSIRIYGLLHYFSELHGPATRKIYPSELPPGVPPGAYQHGTMYRKFTITEGILGGLIAYDLKKSRFYIGIETFPIQMGKYKNYRDSDYQKVYPDEGGSVKRLGPSGRLGAQFAMGNWWLRGEYRWGGGGELETVGGDILLALVMLYDEIYFIQ